MGLVGVHRLEMLTKTLITVDKTLYEYYFDKNFNGVADGIYCWNSVSREQVMKETYEEFTNVLDVFKETFEAHPDTFFRFGFASLCENLEQIELQSENMAEQDYEDELVEEAESSYEEDSDN